MELHAKYCLGIDNRGEDLFISIWAEDGIWQIGPKAHQTVGNEAIKKTTRDLICASIPDSHHHPTNVSINLIDKANAEGVGNVFDTHYGGDVSMVIAGGVEAMSSSPYLLKRLAGVRDSSTAV